MAPTNSSRSAGQAPFVDAGEVFAPPTTVQAPFVDTGEVFAPPPSSNRPVATSSSSSSTPFVNDPAPSIMSEEEQIEAVRRKFPSYAYLLEYPDIRKILIDAATLNWTASEMIGALVQTPWWRERSATMRQWEALRRQDPAEAQRQLSQETNRIFSLASREGITLTRGTAATLAQNSLQFGWSSEDLALSLAEEARKSPETGKTGNMGATVSSIIQKGREYMVPISEKDARDWAINIFSGTQTLQGAETWIKNQSKARFPHLSDEIEAGTSPDLYYRPLKNYVSQILEINPEDMNLMDEKWVDLTSVVNENGTKRALTYTEAANWARDRPEWMKTQNANQRAGRIASLIGATMGRY